MKRVQSYSHWRVFYTAVCLWLLFLNLFNRRYLNLDQIAFEGVYLAGNYGRLACFFVEIVVFFFLVVLKLFIRGWGDIIVWVGFIAIDLYIFASFVGGGLPIDEGDVLLRDLHIGDDFVAGFGLLWFNWAVIAVDHF